MKKPSDILTISKGKEKLRVTRKAYDVIYSAHGYKVDNDPNADDEAVNADGGAE